MRTNLTCELQLTDGLLTDQLTKRSRNQPLGRLAKFLPCGHVHSITQQLIPSQAASGGR